MNKIGVLEAASLYGVSRKTIERWCYAAQIDVDIEGGKAVVDLDALKAAGRRLIERSAETNVQTQDVNVQTHVQTDDTAETNVQTQDVNVQTQLSVDTVRAAYPWTLKGCLMTDHIEDAALRHQVRMLHGGYMDEGGWRSSVGGTAALAERPDDAYFAKIQVITRAQWANWRKHRAS